MVRLFGCYPQRSARSCDARHRIRQLVQFDFVAAEMRRHAALREHRQIVRDRQGMAEIMRDEDHGLPLVARMYDMIQHPSRLPHRERGSRLVEHEKRGAEKHRACDRERLALAA